MPRHIASHSDITGAYTLVEHDHPPFALSSSFILRLVSLAVLLVAEWLPISVFIHTGRGGQSASRGILAFTSLFLAFGYLRNKNAIRIISSHVKEFQISWPYLLLHFCAMLAFLAFSAAPGKGGVAEVCLSMAWYAAGVGGLVSGACAFLPPKVWRDVLGSTGNLWIYALAGGALAWELVTVSWSVWNSASLRPVADITFRFVQLLLRPFLSDLLADRSNLIIGSPKFEITVGDACSGLEGAGLMLVFSIVWLWLFRREVRFPRALLLVPASIGGMFVLNAVRIAALVLIGNAGAPAIAMGGFHSQAGWIAFNALALVCTFAVPRVSWLRADGAESRTAPGQRNPSIPYLLPFASILATGMVSRALSAHFEWLYPLRFLAAAIPLWAFRQSYKDLKWRLSWVSPLTGAVVFVMWIALDRGPHADNGIAAGLASMPYIARVGWLFFRTLAAAVTVPVAEELAFRGFLLRRLVSSDFDTVDFRRFTWLAFLVSSLIFGLMHGDRWIAGSLAGMLYAMTMFRRGSIGDAVVAHATTNAMLAGWVLIGGNWHLW